MNLRNRSSKLAIGGNKRNVRIQLLLVLDFLRKSFFFRNEYILCTQLTTAGQKMQQILKRVWKRVQRDCL